MEKKREAGRQTDLRAESQEKEKDEKMAKLTKTTKEHDYHHTHTLSLAVSRMKNL